MNHKKALKKILKWAGSLLLSSLFTAPVIFILWIYVNTLNTKS